MSIIFTNLTDERIAQIIKAAQARIEKREAERSTGGDSPLPKKETPPDYTQRNSES